MGMERFVLIKYEVCHPGSLGEGLLEGLWIFPLEVKLEKAV